MPLSLPRQRAHNNRPELSRVPALFLQMAHSKGLLLRDAFAFMTYIFTNECKLGKGLNGEVKPIYKSITLRLNSIF